jgi:branched-chain amino acid transport system substrate-binding protein
VESLNICDEVIVFIEKKILPFRSLRLLVPIAALVGLLACSPPEPILLGYVGGLSGRVADLGVEGRNGATLAVEIRNRAGGVKGRRVELLAEDDQQDPEVARRAVGTLIDRKVAAIVGPMTSAMAMVAVPLVNQAQLVMVSPTATTNALAGLDDHFFRVLAGTSRYATKSADYHFNRVGLRQVVAVFDLNNKSYTESWLEDYRQ